MVQKTVRIDTRLEEDLELLSKILNRSQNDILNLSLENLFKENSQWFRYDILADGLYDFLANISDESKFSAGGVTVDAKWNEKGDEITLNYSFTSEAGDNDHVTYTFKDTGELKDKLIELAEMVDSEDPWVEKWLQNRTDYK